MSASPDIAISNLLSDLWLDLQHPHLYWQLLAIGGCLLVAWAASRFVRHQHVDEGTSRALRFGHSGLKRLVLPLLTYVLLLIVRAAMKPYFHVTVISVAIPLFASLAVIRCVFFMLRESFRHSQWLRQFERLFAGSVWFAVALYITGVWPDLIDALESVGFSVGKQRLNLWLLMQGVVLIGAALLASLWLGSLIEARVLHKMAIEANLRVVLSRIVRAGLVLLAVMISLPWVGIDLTALSVFSGAIGVGLGFGLQKIASNYVAGFIILLERSIRIGNVISVGADKGQVTHITTRYTVLKTGNGVESLIPNESLVNSPVQSETFSDAKVRYVHTVQIAAAHDPEQAMQLMLDATRQQQDVLSEPAPQAFLMNFAETGMTLELQYWLEDPVLSPQQVRSAVNLGIWKGFAAAGIQMATPQREVFLHQASPKSADI